MEGSRRFRELGGRAGAVTALPRGEALFVLRMARARAKRGPRGAPHVGTKLVRTGSVKPRALREQPVHSGDGKAGLHFGD